MDFIDFSGYVMIEFYGEGCFNCQMMAPIINNLESRFPRIRFYRINADQHSDLIHRYQITSLPSLLLFRNGKLLTTIIGMKTQSVLERIINDWLI